MKNKKDISLEFLSDVFLKCPNSNKEMILESIKGAESGLNYLEIICRGDGIVWKFKVECEEL